MVEAVLMIPVETAFGLIGTVIFVAVVNYLRSSLDNMEEHQDLSLARFFIDDSGLKAFELLIVGAFIYAIAMLITAVEFSTGNKLMLLISRALIILVAGILVHVAAQVMKVTEPASE